VKPLAILALWAAVASGQDTVTIRTNVYVVSGATLREIRSDIEAKKPWQRKTDGYTRCKIDWKYTTDSSGADCRLASLNIKTDITITVPTLAAPAKGGEVLQTHWKTYLKALLEHENGHRAIGLAAAAEIRKRLTALGPASDRNALAKTIKREAEKVLSEFQKRQDEYDKTTDNGRTQGAEFP